jgi:hypothetical protein
MFAKFFPTDDDSNEAVTGGRASPSLSVPLFVSQQAFKARNERDAPLSSAFLSAFKINYDLFNGNAMSATLTSIHPRSGRSSEGKKPDHFCRVRSDQFEPEVGAACVSNSIISLVLRGNSSWPDSQIPIPFTLFCSYGISQQFQRCLDARDRSPPQLNA